MWINLNNFIKLKGECVDSCPENLKKPGTDCMGSQICCVVTK